MNGNPSIATLAKTIDADVRSANRGLVEAYFRTGDRIVQASLGSGYSITRCVDLLVKGGLQSIGTTTIYDCVKAAGRFSARQREAIVQTGGSWTRVRELASDEYTDAQRSDYLSEIKSGRRLWTSIRVAGDDVRQAKLRALKGRSIAELKRDARTEKRPMTEESREDLLNEVTIRCPVDGQVEDEQIENALMALRSRIGARRLLAITQRVCKLGGKE
jgi:hypothetical protein